MAQCAAHLARIEIQVFFPVYITDHRAPAPDHDWPSNGVGIDTAAETVFSGQLKEFSFGQLLCHGPLH